MASDDPDFESKAADIIGLYLNPPRHAAVFCVDEKTAIQALDRLDPVLPLSPGRAECHGFEYYRHGTLSVYAALDTASGWVHFKTAARHTSRAFVAFLNEVVLLSPRYKQIHLILDNLSVYKTTLVSEFLEQNPRVNFHFIPTYSPWLNQVELWFAKVERVVIARGIFSSTFDLARKLRRHTNAYSANAALFSGSIRIRLDAFLLTISLRQATSEANRRFTPRSGLIHDSLCSCPGLELPLLLGASPRALYGSANLGCKAIASWNAFRAA